MRNVRDREKGFSLTEMILSIAALAVLSGFILQLFLTAAQVNVRAEEYDQAALLCEEAIETAIAYDDFVERVIYLDKYWEQTAESVAAYALSFSAEPTENAHSLPLSIGQGNREAVSTLWSLCASLRAMDAEEPICEVQTRRARHTVEEVSP